MRIAETLAFLRKESGYTQKEVADHFTKAGQPLTSKSISRWETGSTEPGIAQFLELCKLYKVGDVLAVFDSTEEKALNDLGRQRLLEYLRLLQSNDRYLVTPAVRKRITRRIPLYDLPVSAGTGQFLDSEHYELIEVDDTVSLDATFAVRISGDSMLPQYKDGQIIYIKPQQTLEHGEIGIFVHNGEALCKQWGIVDGNAALISLNPEYTPRVIGAYDELRVLGKVVV